MNTFATLSKATAIAAAVAGLLAVQAIAGIWNLSNGLEPIPAHQGHSRSGAVLATAACSDNHNTYRYPPVTDVQHVCAGGTSTPKNARPAAQP